MLNYTTFAELDSECRAAAEINQDQIITPIRQRIIDHAIYQVYGLLDGANHPFWRRFTTLTPTADQETLADTTVNGGILTALSASAHTVTRSTGSFPAGAILDIVLALRTTGARVAQYKARVTIAGATATYEVIGSVVGSETTYAGANHTLFVNVMKKLSATSADLSTQYLKEVVKVFDDQGTGGKERSFRQIRDSKLFGGIWDDPFHVNEIAVYHSGNTLYFDVGSTAIAMGVVQIEYTAKPAIYTDATKNNLIDCPPEENGTVKDQVVAEFLKATNQQVPDQLQKALALIQKRTEQAQADRMKAMELRGKGE